MAQLCHLRFIILVKGMLQESGHGRAEKIWPAQHSSQQAFVGQSYIVGKAAICVP